MPSTITVRRRTLALGTAAVVTTAALVGASASWAATQVFSDVPATHPFADEIEWMKDTGISTGYGDGTYRPNDPVTRQAMSAFLQRAYDLRDDVGVFTASDSVYIDSTGWEQVAQTTVTVPAGTTADLVATFSGSATCSEDDPLATDYCLVQISVESTPMPPGEVPFAGTGLDSYTTYASYSVQGVIPDVDPGTYTVTVHARRARPVIDHYYIDHRTLVAQAILRPAG